MRCLQWRRITTRRRRRCRQTSTATLLILKLDRRFLCLPRPQDSRLGRRRVRTTPILPTFTPAHSDLLLDHQIPQDIPWHHLLASQPHLQELRDSKHRQEQDHLGSCHRPDSNLLQASDVVELGEEEKKKINLCITRLFCNISGSFM